MPKKKTFVNIISVPPPKSKWFQCNIFQSHSNEIEPCYRSKEMISSHIMPQS